MKIFKNCAPQTDPVKQSHLQTTNYEPRTGLANQGPAIEVENLTCAYENKTILKDVSFSVKERDPLHYWWEWLWQEHTLALHDWVARSKKWRNSLFWKKFFEGFAGRAARYFEIVWRPLPK